MQTIRPVSWLSNSPGTPAMVCPSGENSRKRRCVISGPNWGFLSVPTVRSCSNAACFCEVVSFSTRTTYSLLRGATPPSCASVTSIFLLGRSPPAFESIEVSIIVSSPAWASFGFSQEICEKRRAKIQKMSNRLNGPFPLKRCRIRCRGSGNLGKRLN